MASLLEKVSTLVTANLHALVDQALKSNSLTVIDQYIRQVETNLAALEDAAATVGGETRSIWRRLAEQEQRHQEIDRAIDLFLAEGNEPLAIAAQSQLNSVQRLVTTYQAQLQRQEGEFRQLLAVKVKLEARLTTMKQERQELHALLELAKSKEIVVRTMKSLDALMGSDDSDIQRIAESVYVRLDKANTAGELRAAGLDAQMNHLLANSTVQIQLAERRQRLGITPLAIEEGVGV